MTGGAISKPTANVEEEVVKLPAGYSIVPIGIITNQQTGLVEKTDKTRSDVLVNTRNRLHQIAERSLLGEAGNQCAGAPVVEDAIRRRIR